MSDSLNMLLDKLKKLYLLTLQKNGLSEKEYQALNAEHRELLDKKNNKYFLKEEYRKGIKVVLTGGVFDIIHPGHIYTLREAKKYGDLLVVVVATDETVKKIKKRDPIHPQKLRVEMVNSVKYVDIAIAGKKDWRKILQKVDPDVVVFGYDQEVKEIQNVKIVKLKKFFSYKNSKTGKIRKILGL
ncbi:MAG: adenylyltransferase/cytidyltransferase family protein [Candidatus Anstonellaceae archaeon]